MGQIEKKNLMKLIANSTVTEPRNQEILETLRKHWNIFGHSVCCKVGF